MRVSAGFFTLLGRPPALGRDVELGDEIEGSGDVVILSHALWMRRFQGDPAAVGRTVRLSGRPFRVVGVLPRGFQHVGGTFQTYGHGEPVDVWWPLAVPREEQNQHRFSHYYNVVGRMRSDASRAAVEEDLRRTAASAATRYPAPPSPWKPKAVPLKEEIVGTAGVHARRPGRSGAGRAVAGLRERGRAAAGTRGPARRARSAYGRRWAPRAGALARQLLVESLRAGGGGRRAGRAGWRMRRSGPSGASVPPTCRDSR